MDSERERGQEQIKLLKDAFVMEEAAFKEELEKLKVVIEGASVLSVPTDHMTSLDITLGAGSDRESAPGIVMESNSFDSICGRYVECAMQELKLHTFLEALYLFI